MLSRLPPRLHKFVREVWFVTVFYLAVVGLVAIHQGTAEPPPWWLPTAALIGIALGCSSDKFRPTSWPLVEPRQSLNRRSSSMEVPRSSET